MTSLNESTAKLMVLEEKQKGAVERIDKHEVRIDRLESEVGAISRLDAILEMQVSINEKQSEYMENFTQQSEKTFQAITQNLTQLNMSTELLKEELISVRGKFETEIEKGKVSMNDVGVKIFYGLIMIIPSIVLAWILTKSGLK